MTSKENSHQELSCFAHTHIDPVWYWPREEGCVRTIILLRAFLELTKRDPKYKFVFESASFLNMIVHRDPALFTELRSAIDSGRAEPVGGTWTECDTNMLDEEALIRQFTDSRKIYKELGRYPSTGWMVDAKGLSAQIPQLLRKAGLNAILFARSINRNEDLEGRPFRWKGLDGSEITAFYRQEYHEPRDLQVDTLKTWLDEVGRPEDEGKKAVFYSGGDMACPVQKYRILRTALQETGTDLRYLLPADWISSLDYDSLPVKEGEWNRFYRGTYAGARAIHSRLRRAQSALLTAERLAVFDILPPQLTKSPYFEEMLEQLLDEQFHDTVDGLLSDTPACDSVNNLQNIAEWGQKITGSALYEHTEKQPDSYLVFHPGTIERSEVVYLPLADPGSEWTVTVDGQQIKSQKISQCDGSSMLAVYCEQLKPLELISMHRVAIREVAGKVPQDTERDGELPEYIETDYFTVKISSYGTIRYLKDKRNNKIWINDEIGAGQFEFWYDSGSVRFLKLYGERNPGNFVMQSPELISSGEVGSLIRSNGKWTPPQGKGVSVTREIFVPNNCPWIDFMTYVTWEADGADMNVLFPFAENGRTRYSIPFGSLTVEGRKDTHPYPDCEEHGHPMENVWPIQKWVSYNDAEGTCALFTNALHGTGEKENTLFLGLLRSTPRVTSAPEMATWSIHSGYHTFQYRMYITTHSETYREETDYQECFGEIGTIPALAEAWQWPIIVSTDRVRNDGPASLNDLFVCTDNGLVITAVKPTDDDENTNGFVIRFYEALGETRKVAFCFPCNPSAVWKTTIYEEPETKMELRNRRTIFTVKRWEIVTLLIER